MNKETFISQVTRLGKLQDKALKAEEILGFEFSTEGLVGELIDGYGDAILTAASNGKELPDHIWERFWNVTLNFGDSSHEDIAELYEEIMNA